MKNVEIVKKRRFLGLKILRTAINNFERNSLLHRAQDRLGNEM